MLAHFEGHIDILVINSEGMQLTVAYEEKIIVQELHALRKSVLGAGNRLGTDKPSQGPKEALATYGSQ